MRINRRFLYAGVFLVALGAVLVAADLHALDLGVVRDALRLWPIAVVLVGVAIVVRRSPAAVPAGLLAAAIPGLALGGAVAVGPRFVVDCASAGALTPGTVRNGPFQPGDDISLRVRCGTFTMHAEPGAPGWSAAVGDRRGPAPTIETTAGALLVDARGSVDWPAQTDERDSLDLVVPSGDLGAVSATFTAADSTIDLAATRARNLDVTATGSRVVLDLSGASIATLSASASFSQLGLIVPSGSDLTADLRVTGGDVRICTNGNSLEPVGLRITGRGFAHHLSVRGESASDRDIDYESPDYATATRHADLRINASFGSIEIDPIGGCK
jgi:hypothetical protein